MNSEAGVRELAGDVAAIRQILAKYGRLAVDAHSLQDDSNLYLAGLTSLATVNVMLALETHFDIEFPDAMLGRQTFTSIESIAEAITELTK
jgi:acyl carrier protein